MAAHRTVRTALSLILTLALAVPAFAQAIGDAAPAAVTAAAAADDDGAPIAMRRFALVAGANDGGPDRVLLRFARSDAEAFARVMQDLGAVAPGDTLLLTEPTPDTLRAGFLSLRQMLAAAEASDPGVRREVVFYFSGHSDEQGLLLGGTRVTYREIRSEVDALRADVRIAVLDSCASGAFTRGKGGVRRAPFQVDTAPDVRGYAFLTSASADEPAQESDRLGGSFFTHHLVAGLRGAADTSRDGRVTLNEAYQYAFHGTLANTESTFAGAQHPNYDMRLAGAGDLVLTDLRETSALLVLGEDLDGRLYIRDDEGRLAAELDKHAGRPMSLGLAPGLYTVTVERDGVLRRGAVDLSDAQPTPLDVAALGVVRAEVATTRGPAGSRDIAVEGADDDAVDYDDIPDGYRLVPFNLSLVPGLSIAGADSTKVIQYFGLHFFGGYAAQIRGAELAGLWTWEIERTEGGQAAGLFNYGGLRASGAEIAGLANVAGDLVGVQVAGITNVGWGEMGGIQVAGVTNVVGGGRGVQIAALANVASGDLVGGQFGAFNIASGKVSGVQLGVFNYAEDVDAPIGVLSIVKDGQIHGEIWASDTAAFSAALRLGSKYVYNLFAVGLNPFGKDDATRWMLGWGIGGHIPVAERWAVDIDLIGYHVNTDTWTHDFNVLGKFRVSASYSILPRLAVFAGVSLNAWAGVRDDASDWRIGSLDDEHFAEYDLDVAFWPGFFGGVRF